MQKEDDDDDCHALSSWRRVYLLFFVGKVVVEF